MLDNIGSLAPGIDENTKKDWDPINQWFLELRSVGISIVMVHHKGKKGDQRGTSAREDNIDVAFELKRPPNYKAQDGATFNVMPTKTRSFYGDDAVPFNFRVFTCREGYAWQTDSCSKGGRENFWEILSLLHEGKRQKEIAEIVDCSAARVSQVKKEAKEKGFLNENDKLTERGKELYESFRAEIKYKGKK